MKSRMIIAAIAAALFMGTVFGAAYWKGQSIQTVPPAGTAQEPPSQKLEEKREKPNQIAVLFCGIDNTSWLTDVIIYGVLDLDQNQVRLLQIPRDSFVGNTYPTGKINAVYGHPSKKGQGIQELEKVIENQLALPVDYYVTITLEGFRSVIDAFGGIVVDVPYTIEYLPGKTIYPGEQLLNGQQAEWFVRYRAGYATGDIGRISAQKLFLQSCFETAKSRGITVALDALGENYSQIKTDMPLHKMLSAAKSVFAMEAEDISVFLAPGKGTQNRSYAVYQWDAEEMAQLLNSQFRPKGEEVSAESLNIQQLPEETKPYRETTPVKEQIPSQPAPNQQEEEAAPAKPNQGSMENSWDEFLDFLNQQE